MNSDLYIKKFKKLRNYKELYKASLWSGLLCFFLLFVWFIIIDEAFLYSPYAVDEIISLTTGFAALLAMGLMILSFTFYLLYRATMRSYGAEMNMWMDELGEEGMVEVFAGRGRAPLFWVITLVLFGLIIGIGTGKAQALNKKLEQASDDASIDLEDFFSYTDIEVSQWDDEREVSLSLSEEDYYGNYRLKYAGKSDYFNPYEASYYGSFYLRSFTAEDIMTDLTNHLDTLQELPYPAGESADFLLEIPLDDFFKALHEATEELSGDYSKEFRYSLKANGYDISVYLDMDVNTADNPDYHNITVSLYSYCWDFEY